MDGETATAKQDMFEGGYPKRNTIDHVHWKLSIAMESIREAQISINYHAEPNVAGLSQEAKAEIKRIGERLDVIGTNLLIIYKRYFGLLLDGN